MPPAPTVWDAYAASRPEAPLAEVIGGFLEVASLLGRRTGELHVALAGGNEDAAFAPEPVTPFARRAQYQSMRNLLVRTFDMLEQARGLLAPDLQLLA